MRLDVNKRGLSIIEDIRPVERVISVEKTVSAMRIVSTMRAVFIIRVNIKLFNIIPAVIFAMGVALKPLNIIIIIIITRIMRKKEIANEKG